MNSPPAQHTARYCVLTAAGVTAGQPPVGPELYVPGRRSAQVPQRPEAAPPAMGEHHPVRSPRPGDPLPGSVPAQRAAERQQRRRGPQRHLQPLRRRQGEGGYWADGPKSEFHGHMAAFAQAISRMRQNTLDQDVKLFFVLGNALMDASISAWASKYQYDSGGQPPPSASSTRTSWSPPGWDPRRLRKVLGQGWMPYQALNVVTPAFPEYVSEHSTFSAAGHRLGCLLPAARTSAPG